MSIPPVCPDCELRHFSDCPDVRDPATATEALQQLALIPDPVLDVPIMTGHLVPDTLRIRSSRYRGIDGWTLSGCRRDDTRRISIFFEHKSCAERTRARMRSGAHYEVSLRDFELDPDA